MRKKRVLFIPADVIKSEVSRSFYFARFLSEENELYFVYRLDPQNAYFENRKVSKLYTLKCFFASLFTFFKVYNHPVWNYKIVRIPFMSHMVIHRLLGMIVALKISRWFNKVQLKRLAKKIKPDFIFYADGFDLYPCLNGYACFSDIQDDFDSGNFRDNNYNLNYSKKNILKSNLNFVVSNQAARNLGELYKCKFEYIPNGVETSAMLRVNMQDVESLKNHLKINDKYIITYIGADAWYDKNLLMELSRLANSLDEAIHFLIVGNLQSFPSSNVTFVGPVNKEKSFLFYWLSDLGILLKDSNGSNFLRNSIPLKIVQYGIIDKQFLSPPIVWLEEENFKNVTVLNDFSTESIISTILRIKARGGNVNDSKWAHYDWQRIVHQVNNRIEKVLVDNHT